MEALVSLRAVMMMEVLAGVTEGSGDDGGVGWCCQPRSQCALSPAVLLCSQAFSCLDFQIFL